MRLPRTSRFTLISAGLLPLFFAVAPASAGPSCPGGGAPGTITITEKKMGWKEVMQSKELKAEQRCALTKGKEDDGWKIYVVAHLKPAPGAEQVNLVLYDQSKPIQQGDPVQAYQINTRKDAQIMQAEIELKPEEGFKAGGKYKVMITRLIDNKEKSYASTTLELK
jgi:hypothetical protein